MYFLSFLSLFLLLVPSPPSLPPACHLLVNFPCQILLPSLITQALVQLSVKVVLKRKHSTIHEGIPKAGQQVSLHRVYTEPQISSCGHGGISPFHEFPGMPPAPVPQVASPDTFVRGNDIFRTPPGSGAVRTVLTTGIPGIGLTVAVQKFIMDWCKDLANRVSNISLGKDIVIYLQYDVYLVSLQ